MIGTVQVSVKNSRNSYTFTLKRNITILSGDSGTGKTTLYNMIADYNLDGKQSGVTISCDKPLIALGRRRWEEDLAEIQNSVIVIDEDNQYIRTREFAKAVQNSSNYYLIITRNYLHNLPYSVEEIYEITGNKNKKFKHMYNEIDYIYDSPTKGLLPFKPEVIITEDSNSGFQFFHTIAKQNGIECVSARGKSNINLLINSFSDKSIAVIADGAAFGADIKSLVQRQRLSVNKIAIYLPESFEWIILKSGLVSDPEWEAVEIPEEYIDSSKYVSWERYFAELLIDVTKDTGFQKYSKHRLEDFYLHEKSIQKIKDFIKGLDSEHYSDS